MNQFATLASLDLEPIKVKLMHKQSGEGWTLEQATAVEVEYRRFLYLRKAFPNEDIAPSEDVDTFWHYHILDTMKYAQDCEEFFGYFVHHFPYLGMRGEEDLAMHQRIAERTRALYEQAFCPIAFRKNESSYADIGNNTTAFCMITDGGGGTTSGRDATAAYCMLTGGGTTPAKGATAAYCMLTGGGPTSANGAAAAYCMLTGGGTTSAKGATTAYCMLTGSGPTSAKGAAAAYCMLTRVGTTYTTGATTSIFIRPRLDS